MSNVVSPQQTAAKKKKKRLRSRKERNRLRPERGKNNTQPQVVQNSIKHSLRDKVMHQSVHTVDWLMYY